MRLSLARHSAPAALTVLLTALLTLVVTASLVGVGAILVPRALLAEDGAESPGNDEGDPAAESGAPAIKNPYYTEAGWRVWRDDETPVEDVATLVREGGEKKPAVMTLQPTPAKERLYPTARLDDADEEEGTQPQPIAWKPRDTPPDEFAGVWDDVYASWSGLHGYVRPLWHATDGSSVRLRPKDADQFMHFVETRKTADLLRCGINFVHQSTTGMAHTITNGYFADMTATYERIYFSDCLVTAPAHASFTEEWPDRTKDLYLALVPTLFNSVGSSNSETLAITKLMIVGAYLPPESKLTLKRNGLYPSALLYIWKAALPFDVPYDHELRHRIAYRSLGRDDQFGGKYGHAGSERGNLAIEFHRYDEIAHMRNMIRMAQSMDVLPPEALLDGVEVDGGEEVYALKKTALVLQEPGQDVTITVSTAGSYDLRDRPVTVRWKLLYGNHRTTCEPGAEPGQWVIRVPWDGSLPEGRTAIAAVANNGVHDGNPAVVNVFRKLQDIPPDGAGGGYGYASPTANRRPVLLDLQDVVVKPGKKVELPLVAIDPEGRPVRFYKRAGEPGDLDGSLLTVKMPRKGEERLSVTVIASDATAGNSYAAEQVEFVVKPEVHAHIESDTLVGPAPLTVNLTAKGSLPTARSKRELGWEFYTPTAKRKVPKWEELTHDESLSHTFAKPGLYEIALTVKSSEATDRETVQVWVTAGPPEAPDEGILVEANGVRITDGDDAPGAFDHTRFVAGATHTFELSNRSTAALICSRGAVTIEGEHAADFDVVRRPRKRIEVGGYGTFQIEFDPGEAGPRHAVVVVTTGEHETRFHVAGE